jgi:DNA-binding response OmpR family regulator
MTRVLVIDGNKKLTDSVGMQCLEHGIALRMADTFCDGIRHLLETPVSLVLLDSGLAHLPGADLARLFDTVAPGVPVVVRVESGRGTDEQVRFELHGFRVVREPVDVLELVVKAERPARVVAPRPVDAAAALDAGCRHP